MSRRICCRANPRIGRNRPPKGHGAAPRGTLGVRLGASRPLPTATVSQAPAQALVYAAPRLVIFPPCSQ